MKLPNKKILKELCNYLGEDLDTPMCQELLKHVHDFPECQFYIDTVKMTVNLFRETHSSQPVPSEVKKELFRILKSKK
jgi:hypothetical protein